VYFNKEQKDYNYLEYFRFHNFDSKNVFFCFLIADLHLAVFVLYTSMQFHRSLG
jgi:hypothetical protein